MNGDMKMFRRHAYEPTQLIGLPPGFPLGSITPQNNKKTCTDDDGILMWMVGGVGGVRELLHWRSPPSAREYTE